MTWQEMPPAIATSVTGEYVMRDLMEKRMDGACRFERTSHRVDSVNCRGTDILLFK